MARLGGRGRHNGANAIVHLAREVVGRRRTIQNATQEVRNAVILDSLADEDFRALDTTIAERTTSDREFAQTLARLTYAAARAKGFDRCVVDAALRLDSLVPVDDPAHERDRLLRDAYHSAQKASYIRGGRLALGRLGRRAVEAGDLERARVLLHQQLDLGPEKDDTAAEVDSALVLGDILRREGDDDQAQTWYRRAAAGADRLEYRQGVAEALVRQIDTTPSANLETVAALQHQALDAAQRTGDRALEARIHVGLADTLVESERLEDATPYYQNALEIAQETSDLALEARCVTALAHAHRQLGHTLDALEAERSALGIEERLGNRHAAANWALNLGMSELRLRNAEAAVDAFDRARLLGGQIGDASIQQRAEGSLGIAHTLLGHGPETIDHLSRAIELARQARDQSQEARWVSSLGQAYGMFGQTDDAIRVINDAISLAEATNNVSMQAESFTLLGQIYAAQRETIRARDCFTRALQLNRDLGQTADQVTTLTALGTLAADTGQFTQASQLFDQALGLALSTDDRGTATVLYGRMGSLAQKRGDLRSALASFQRSVELAQTLGDARQLSRSLQYLATAQDVMGDPGAVTSYERAITAADDSGDIRGGITMRLNMGMLISRLPEPGAAEDAIGWLSDAANYALEAGPDYSALRKQAEQQIQALGGSTSRNLPFDDQASPYMDYPDASQQDDGRYRETDPERSVSSPMYDDGYDDDSYPDDRYAEPRSGRVHAEDGYDPDRVDKPYRHDEDWRHDDVHRSTERDDRYAYDDDPDSVRLAYDDYDEPGQREPAHYSDRSRYDGDEYAFDAYADRRDQRGGYRFEERERDRDGYEVDRPGDDHYGQPVGQRRSRPDEPYPTSSSPRGYQDDDRYADDDQYDAAAPRHGRSNAHTTGYADDRDNGFERAERRYRDEPSPGSEDEYRNRSRRNGADSRGERTGTRFGADRYGDRFDYEDEPVRDHTSRWDDDDRDLDPRQSSGRHERAGRRNGGGRESGGRGLDDEPSEPEGSRGRRRASLGSMFARATHGDTAPRRRTADRSGAGRRQARSAPPPYHGSFDPDPYQY